VDFSSVTNENFDENSHRQTKQKIPKSSLAGKYITYIRQNKTKLKKRENSFRWLEESKVITPPPKEFCRFSLLETEPLRLPPAVRAHTPAHND
jgi:hypothetical protein